jgi:hypothetical protein
MDSINDDFSKIRMKELKKCDLKPYVKANTELIAQAANLETPRNKKALERKAQSVQDEDYILKVKTVNLINYIVKKEENFLGKKRTYTRSMRKTQNEISLQALLPSSFKK